MLLLGSVCGQNVGSVPDVLTVTYRQGIKSLPTQKRKSMRYGANMNYEFTARALIYSHLRDIIIEYVSTRRVSYGGNI